MFQTVETVIDEDINNSFFIDPVQVKWAIGELCSLKHRAKKWMQNLKHV